MSKSTGVVARLLVPAFIVAGLMAGPTLAQEKAKAKSEAPKVTLKVLLENYKVRVYEARIPAGASAANIARPYRIGRALTNGTIERTFADGKKDVAHWKAGEVKELGPHTQYIPKNIGKKEFHIFVVEPKSK